MVDEAVQHLDRLGALILDDVGDGPPPAEFAAAANAARDRVAKLAVPALSQVAGLVAGVAEALAANAIEWNTSLGGTLMATVDDIRHLVTRAAQLGEEDNEHLHHRASELTPYLRDVPVTPAPQPPAAAVVPEPAPVATAPTPTPLPIPQAPIVPIESLAPDPPPSARNDGIVPISELFYADNGPHIVSGGTPAAATSRSDLLGRGIDALDNLTMKPIAAPTTFRAMEVVPVESLVYRGRAALERAAVIREQIKIAGGVAAPATLEEMYDLIGLALKD